MDPINGQEGMIESATTQIAELFLAYMDQIKSDKKIRHDKQDGR